MKFETECAIFGPASTCLDHSLMVACGLTHILEEGSGCRWEGGAVGIPDHDSWLFNMMIALLLSCC